MPPDIVGSSLASPEAVRRMSKKSKKNIFWPWHLGDCTPLLTAKRSEAMPGHSPGWSSVSYRRSQSSGFAREAVPERCQSGALEVWPRGLKR